MNPPPPPYAMLGNPGVGGSKNVQPPPNHANVPRYNSVAYPKRSKTGCIIRTMCCCYCVLFLLIFIAGATILIFVLVYEPRYPAFRLDKINLKTFKVSPDMILNTQIEVSVRAENQNTGVMFDYGEPNSVEVIYSNLVISSGVFPSFRHGFQNTTNMVILLKGKNQVDQEFVDVLLDQQSRGEIPIQVEVNVPIKVLLSIYESPIFNVKVDCFLVVDNIDQNRANRIISSNYKVYVKRE